MVDRQALSALRLGGLVGTAPRGRLRQTPATSLEEGGFIRHSFTRA